MKRSHNSITGIHKKVYWCRVGADYLIKQFATFFSELQNGGSNKM
jgi:hypothetical protein